MKPDVSGRAAETDAPADTGPLTRLTALSGEVPARLVADRSSCSAKKKKNTDADATEHKLGGIEKKKPETATGTEENLSAGPQTVDA